MESGYTGVWRLFVAALLAVILYVTAAAFHNDIEWPHPTTASGSVVGSAVEAAPLAGAGGAAAAGGSGSWAPAGIGAPNAAVVR